MSVENGVPKSFKHLGKVCLKVGVVASGSYVTQRQNPFKVVKFPLEMEKETWKSKSQETRTSGTHHYQVQNVYKIVKFLSLLIQKYEI